MLLPLTKRDLLPDLGQRIVKQMDNDKQRSIFL
jgi:hypothetical protein